MTSNENFKSLKNFQFLRDAAKSLLGYTVFNEFNNYLGIIEHNEVRLNRGGFTKSWAAPTALCSQLAFDFTALSLPKLEYILGVYRYIMSAHKGANYCLMKRQDSKQVLFLRGYDFEASLAIGSVDQSGFKPAMGMYTMDTTLFDWKLGNLLGQDFKIFKVLCSKDVHEILHAVPSFSCNSKQLVELARYQMLSVYLNALEWKNGITKLLERMDHYFVFLSSLTESVLWELEQLDTDDRRGRVTVIFDEQAIQLKDSHLASHRFLREKFGNEVIWSKEGAPPKLNMQAIHEHLAQRFFVTSKEAFEQDIERHRDRIQHSWSRLPPGVRETSLEFNFQPSIDGDQLQYIRDFSTEVETQINTRTGEKGIDCLPVFLNLVQMRVFLTLLMGEHDQTGRALAAYTAIMEGAKDFFGNLENDHDELGIKRESRMDILSQHAAVSRYIGENLLSCGLCHQFENFSLEATVTFNEMFDHTKAVVDSFFAKFERRINLTVHPPI